MADRPSARAALEARRDAGQKSLIGFLTAGYPDWDRFERAVEIFVDAGVDVLEMGVPFSDPLADGATIQRSSQAALESGVTLTRILERVASRGTRWPIPVVLMSYVNPFLAYGADRFARDAAAAGVSGLLVSDLPPEELPDLWRSFRESGLETAVLVAPTTAAARIPRLADAATGFIYCVSRTGVTGAGAGLARNLREQITQVRQHTELPIVLGFGIRSPEDAVRAGSESGADGVVIGARLIELQAAGMPAEKADGSAAAGAAAEKVDGSAAAGAPATAAGTSVNAGSPADAAGNLDEMHRFLTAVRAALDGR